MDRVRIGFVGVGHMGQVAHLRNYAALPDCEVAAIAELREGLGRRVAARYGVPGVYRSHADMLAAERLDGIVASQPFTRHGVLVPELLKAGVPLFIEKPLAGCLEAGERIVQALRRSGTWLMVGYHKRSDPAAICAREEIERLRQSGEIGPLRYVRILMPAGDWTAGAFSGLMTTDEPMPELDFDPPPGDMDKATYEAYLGFVNYYIHQVNLMRWLLGEPYEVTHAEPSGVVMVVRSRSGIPGVIEMSPYTTTRDWQESALTAFQHGFVRLELPAPLACRRAGSVEIFKDPPGAAAPERLSPVLPPVDAMRQQAIHFIRAIRGEARPPCEAEEALEDLKVARQYIRLWKGH